MPQCYQIDTERSSSEYNKTGYFKQPKLEVHLSAHRAESILNFKASVQLWSLHFDKVLMELVNIYLPANKNISALKP